MLVYLNKNCWLKYLYKNYILSTIKWRIWRIMILWIHRHLLTLSTSLTLARKFSVLFRTSSKFKRHLPPPLDNINNVIYHHRFLQENSFTPFRFRRWNLHPIENRIQHSPTYTLPSQCRLFPFYIVKRTLYHLVSEGTRLFMHFPFSLLPSQRIIYHPPIKEESSKPPSPNLLRNSKHKKTLKKCTVHISFQYRTYAARFRLHGSFWLSWWRACRTELTTTERWHWEGWWEMDDERY